MIPAGAWKGARLTFNWPDHRQISFSLAGFILLAALAHGIAFYVFQIVYPPSATIAPPPAQVSLLAPTTAENRELLRWIESHDPALLAQPQRAAPPLPLDIPYVPSFAKVDDEPVIPDPPRKETVFPSGLSGSALIERVSRGPARPLEPAPPVPTTALFSSSLAGRAPKPAFKWKPTPAAALAPARFLVGVDSGGVARFVFAQESSGDSAMDAQALAQLEALRFSLGEKNVEWGFATIAWGADAFASAPAAP